MPLPVLLSESVPINIPLQAPSKGSQHPPGLRKCKNSHNSVSLTDTELKWDAVEAENQNLSHMICVFKL